MNAIALQTPQVPVSPPGRKRKIFLAVLTAHAGLFLLPLAVAMIEEALHPPETVFEINLVDTPSVGPETGDTTTRQPEPRPEPEPQPPPPQPQPEPQIQPQPEPQVMPPPVPMPSPVAEPVAALPMPTPRQVKEPEIKLPPVRTPENRNLDKPKEPPKTPPKNQPASQNRPPQKNSGEPANEWIPVGSKSQAQTLGDKPSNTPQGGPKTDDAYPRTLAAFLKMHWNPPSRAALGGNFAETEIMISISGSGQITSARIVKPSGNAAMDARVRQFLVETRQVPAPPDGRPVRDVRIKLQAEE